tara:strand:- start:1298 stop:2056 length:759 start_codon:yes stop_codon:yes gene_type:complete
MASTYSNDLALELVSTGEKAGLWGSITNTNLKMLETTTAFVSIPILSTTQVLSLADGSATADGKYLYLKFTGTLTGNTTITMPATTSGGNATRVFFIEDATSRTASEYTLSILTTGQVTPLPIPQRANMLLVSNGGTPATTLGGLLNKGYVVITASVLTAYTAVAGDQVMVDTQSNPVTISLPAAPNALDEVTIMDVSAANGFATNNCIISRNGLNINGAALNYTMDVNNQCVTFIYTNNATKGWVLKSTNQ